MQHVKAELIQKLKAIYPDITAHRLNLDVEFNADKNAWVVKLERDDAKLHTYLDKADADACLEGVQCVYLGVQVGQFIQNFKIREKEKI